ncbi:hypothetical protein SBA6_1210002 [Candidatus Sulfopaludibacter sp. SbA6]|nr:hypothetical protein SBA6_1210002 [Candidatus Sulfopaludibacter sp. SbA6]
MDESRATRKWVGRLPIVLHHLAHCGQTELDRRDREMEDASSTANGVWDHLPDYWARYQAPSAGTPC